MAHRSESTAHRTETSATSAARGRRARKAVLLFFYSPSSGPSRRMDGIVSWLYVRERKRLNLQTVNVDVHDQVAERFDVSSVPALILLKDGEVVCRLDGRVTGQQIDDAVLPHLGR